MTERQDKTHDKGYKQLLANTRTFLQLIQTFVKEDWVKDINEKDLIKIDKSYILPDFEHKEADLVYRLKTKEKDVVFYLLLELQSTTDHLMPYRLLLYMVEIWRDIFNNTAKKDRERKSFRLPAIIPAVLYNGAGKWTVALNFKEMQTSYQQFEKHLLDFRYLLFDVNRYREEELQQIANLVSVIFTLDRKTKQPQEITKRLHQAADTLKNMSSDEFKQFISWFKNVLKARMPEPVQEKLEQIVDQTNPWEVEEMITNVELAIEELQKQALQEGLEKGIERGLERGLEKGREETRLEVAQNLLAIGMEVEKIRQVTGLSKEKIEKLLPRH